jgi:nitroreductase
MPDRRENTNMTPNLSAQLLEIFHRRHACHAFEPGVALVAADLEFILEAGRLSPSSFGLEQWKFLVLTSDAHKAAMQAACFQQPQVGSASALVVILAKLGELAPDHPYAQKLLAREYPGEAFGPALENYRGFHANTDVKAWSISQCHIAAANMMTAATGIGIDSCAIGGFLPDEVCKILAIDPTQYEVALILALGVCAQPAGEKLRLPMQELVEYR